MASGKLEMQKIVWRCWCCRVCAAEEVVVVFIGDVVVVVVAVVVLVLIVSRCSHWSMSNDGFDGSGKRLREKVELNLKLVLCERAS